MKKLVMLACVSVVSFASAHAQFNITNIDCPGSTLTTTRGVNNHGEIVGSTRIGAPRHAVRHAVLIKGGQCIPLAPNTVLGTTYSEAFRINNRGDVVGNYADDNGAGPSHGFLLSKKGVLTTLDFPGASDTTAFGINESGTVVGQWDILDSNGNIIVTHGFTWDGSNFTQVDYPGSANSSANSINAGGELVGEWDDAVIGHGLIRTQKGKFTSYDVPVAGATYTQLDDIGTKGSLVGLYFDADGAAHGFLQAGKTFTTIDYPGAVTTTVWGINNSGQMVGSHYGSDGIPHGYMATPVALTEPASAPTRDAVSRFK